MMGMVQLWYCDDCFPGLGDYTAVAPVPLFIERNLIEDSTVKALTAS